MTPRSKAPALFPSGRAGWRLGAALATLACLAALAHAEDLSRESDFGPSERGFDGSTHAARPDARNTASIVNHRTGHLAQVVQNGSGNQAAVSQSGDGNALSLVQQGAGNHARAVQSGSHNALEAHQAGKENGLHIVQEGGSRAKVTQTGNQNSATLVQPASSPNIVLSQHGDKLSVKLVQY